MLPYSISNRLVLRHRRYVLNPSLSFCITIIISEFHDTPRGRHAGVKHTHVHVAANFFWQGMCQAVERFVASCLLCQQIKYSTQVSAELLQPLPVPEVVWEDIIMDFITGLYSIQLMVIR